MKIVLSAIINEKALALLREAAEVVVLEGCTAEKLAAAVPDATGVGLRGSTRLTAEMIRRAPNLRVIGRHGVGYDTVDVEAATERGIPVVYTPGANTDSVVAHAWALLLALARRLPFWHRCVREDWEQRYVAMNVDLLGRTLGLIGFGRIGRGMVPVAQAFGMRVLAVDPYVEEAQAASAGATLVSLEELLQESDFISLHAPLSEETRGLIDREAVAKMKPGAILVNTARGGLVDLDALEEGLRSGKLAGVGLDVFPVQPPDPNHPLFTYENFLGTPHVAAMTPETDERIALTMAAGMLAVLRGERPANVVNPEVWEKGL